MSRLVVNDRVVELTICFAITALSWLAAFWFQSQFMLVFAICWSLITVAYALWAGKV